MSDRTCSVEGCEGDYYGKGMCKKHWAAVRYVQNREKIRTQNRVWIQANHHKVREYSATYAAKHPGRRREQSLQWYAADPERRRESSRRWAKANPDATRRFNHLRRARKIANGVFVITVRDWQRLCDRYRHCCAYCGIKAPLTIDHVVPLVRGGRHSIGNLLPACASCNHRKRSRLLIEWSGRPT